MKEKFARAMAVVPHGDDITLFAGGTIARWATDGCEILVVRVTQDEKDSFELSVEDTIAANKEEFEAAMKVLGVSQTCHLGYRDCELLDVPYSELREKIIRKIREFKPEVILSFDPGISNDDNPDHLVVARAVADSVWAASYPNFHPEHKDQGLDPYCPLGCYYFTKQFNIGDYAVDITAVIEKKLQAVVEHRNMLRTMLADQKRRIKIAGYNIPAFDSISLDDYEDYWRSLVLGSASLAAAGSDESTYVERFRSTLLTDDDPLVSYLVKMDEES